MKNLKRIASAMLSLSMLAGMAGTGAGIQMNASAAGSSVTYTSVTNKWSSKMTSEKSKFPNDRFWNHKTGSNSEDGCSTKACNHKSEGKTYCNYVAVEKSLNKDWRAYVDVGQVHTLPSVDTGKACQCYGFARKLSKDFWGTTQLHWIAIDNNYTPKVGDHVRLGFKVNVGNNQTNDIGHSIFITGIDANGNVTFAEANGEMEDCKIRWGRTKYYSSFKYNSADGTYSGTGTQKTVNLSYLRTYGETAERPCIKGDLNLNDKIDNEDVEIFRTTYRANGNLKTYIPAEAYDVNSDGQLTEADYTQIRYYAGLNYADGYLYGTGPSVTYKDRNAVPSDGFLYSNGIYKKLDSTTATFLGAFYNSETSFTVKPTVNYNGISYTVTTIGDTYKGGGPGTALGLRNLKSLGIPDSVKTIKKMTFSHSNTNEDKLTQISFTGSNPGLTTIEEGAFYNSTKLDFPFTKCKNLKTIGSYAFFGCTKLTSIDLNQCTELTTLSSQAFYGCSNVTSVNMANCKKLTSIADGVFQKCDKLTSVMFPQTFGSYSSGLLNMKYGTSMGLFATSQNDPARTTTVGLNFLNANSPVRTVILMDKDIAMWRSGKIAVVVCGSVKIKDTRGKVLCSVTNSQMMQVYPSN